MNRGLRISDLSAGYGPIEVLHSVTLDVPAGVTTAVLGRNGAGKSSLLRAIAGTVHSTSGRIHLDGRDLTPLSVSQRAASGVTLVPDRRNVYDGLTVQENLEVFSGGAPVEPALAAFGELRRLLDRRAGTLSGGERQMLALSVALLRPSRVLLLDEVSHGLSQAVVNRLADVIDGLRRSDRVLLLVEPYLHDVLRFADLVYVLRRGEVAFAGEPAELAARGGTG